HPEPITSLELSTLLYFSYGVTRPPPGAELTRGFRVVPSGGALFPIELYVYSEHLVDNPAGLYHYDPRSHSLALLNEGALDPHPVNAVAQPELVRSCSLLLIVTALFERSTFKYGDRGYRFALIEAGHIAQNLNLICSAMQLCSVTIGG